MKINKDTTLDDLATNESGTSESGVILFNETEKDALLGFDVTLDGYIQGVTSDGSNYYVTTSTHIYKYDNSGTLLLSRDNSGDANTHKYLGDLVYVNGYLYTASSNFGTAGPYTSYAVVFDASDLNYVEEHQYSSDDRGDSVTYYNKHFWMPMYNKTVEQYDSDWNFVKSHSMNIDEFTYEPGTYGNGFDGATWISNNLVLNVHEGVYPNSMYILNFDGSNFGEVSQSNRPTYCTQGIHYDETLNKIVSAERSTIPRVSFLNMSNTVIKSILPGGTGALVEILLNTAISSGTDTIMSWTDEVYDSGNLYSAANPTRFIIPRELEGSTVLVQGATRWDSNTSGARYAVIRKNGNNEVAVDSTTSGTNYGRGYSNIGKTFFDVSYGDYFELAVVQSSGSTISLTSGERTFFQITVIK